MIVARRAASLGTQHQAAALYTPEKVKAMILVDTGARLRVAPQIMNYARACAEGKNPPILNPRIGFSLTTDQEVLDQVKIITDAADPTVTFRDWIADDSCDFLSRVSEFSLPSLAIVGEDDELTPVRYAEFFSKNMSDCKISVLKELVTGLSMNSLMNLTVRWFLFCKAFPID